MMCAWNEGFLFEWSIVSPRLSQHSSDLILSFAFGNSTAQNFTFKQFEKLKWNESIGYLIFQLAEKL